MYQNQNEISPVKLDQLVAILHPFLIPEASSFARKVSREIPRHRITIELLSKCILIQESVVAILNVFRTDPHGEAFDWSWAA
jgi:hypothetical protein